MQPVEVNVVGLQATQRAFEGAMNVLAAIASGVWVGRIGIKRELRGEHDAVAELAFADELAEHLFTFAQGVAVSGVDEISAGFDVAVEELAGDALFGSPAPFGTEGHGAEAERADAKAGAAESCVFV